MRLDGMLTTLYFLNQKSGNQIIFGHKKMCSGKKTFFLYFRSFEYTRQSKFDRLKTHQPKSTKKLLYFARCKLIDFLPTLENFNIGENVKSKV